TTKLIKFKTKGTNLIGIEFEERHPTTVESPYNDVGVAIENLFKKCNLLIKQEDTYITSSAGGGLKILVVALTSIISGFSAVRAAEVSGGIILENITIDHPVNKVEKIRKIIESSPDMILFLGGLEKGEVAKLVELFYILSYSKPKNYLTGEKIPLIYAGNSRAVPHLKEILSEHYEIYIEENVRPSLLQENVEEVKELIQKLFTKHVMKIAPGFKGIFKYTANDISPTPLAVEAFLQKYYLEHQKNILAIDIGGATTDIFSIFEEKTNRTVVAQFGLSYNINNIVKEEDSEFVNNFFESGVDYNNFLNYIGNKNVNPTYNPKSREEIQFEMIIASLIIKKSIALHFSKYFKPIYKAITIDGYREVDVLHQLQTFNKKDSETILLSGGIFTVLSPDDTLKVIDTAFDKESEIAIYKDDFFILPHLGNILKNSNYNIDQVVEKNITFCGHTTQEIKTLKTKFLEFGNLLKFNKEKSNVETELKVRVLEFSKVNILLEYTLSKLIFYPYIREIEAGKKLSQETIIASCPEVINEFVTKAIYVRSDEEIEYLKEEHEEFRQGEFIYKKTSTDAFNFRKPSRFSFNYSGKILRIDPVNNIVIFIKETERPDDLNPVLKSMVTGEVTGILNNEIKILISGEIILGKIGFGREVLGKLNVFLQGE
ncbi:glutamate mutase L, partial [Candidatus Dependentiae bacterium]|nr:glutamate mutase L [Candidatus Dependentiae bacterium]